MADFKASHTLIEEDYALLGLSAQELNLIMWETFFQNKLKARPPKKDDRNVLSLLDLIALDEQDKLSDGIHFYF